MKEGAERQGLERLPSRAAGGPEEAGEEQGLDGSSGKPGAAGISQHAD